MLRNGRNNIMIFQEQKFDIFEISFSQTEFIITNLSKSQEIVIKEMKLINFCL